MKIALIILSLCLAMGLLLALGFFIAFPATQIVKADLRIQLSDASGKALANQEVELWEYDYPTQRARTNGEGAVEFKDKGYSFVKILPQFWKKRPEIFPVRLRVPEVDKLYYRFDLEDSGPASYEAFNDSYDYFFGEKWLGTFDAKGRIRNSVRDAEKSYSAVAPANECQCVPLWKAEASLQPAGENRYSIQLRLQQAGVWKFQGN